MVGSRGFEPRSARSERAASANCATSRDGLVPLGGLEPPPHGLRARHAALTLQRGLERMAGFEPAPQGLEGPQATVTPHSPWFGLRVSNPSLHAGNVGCSSTPRPNMDRCRSPAHRHPSVVKDPALASRQSRVAVPPVWRQRQDSNPDPRALEARMLPLHHAADSAHVSTVRRDTTLPLTWPASLRGRRGQNKKGLLGDRPRRPVSR